MSGTDEFEKNILKECSEQKKIAVPQITAELSSNHPFWLLLDTSDFHRLIHDKFT